MIYCNGARGRRKGCATGEGIERKGKSASFREAKEGSGAAAREERKGRQRGRAGAR